MPIVAGVDCSTQSTKAVIVDVDTGNVVAIGHAPHEIVGTGGVRETHPRVWRDALADSIAKTGCGRDVAAISVAGQQHGLCVLNGQGEPLRPALLWNDT